MSKPAAPRLRPSGTPRPREAQGSFLPRNLAGRPQRPCFPREQVFVDRAVSWQDAISAARRQGITPEQYGAQRIYWHERCLEVTRRRHAAGAGNGQYIHVIDFGGIDAGISEIPGYWPYLREAAVAVALNYGGVCARIYVARPPRAFLWGWRLLRPFLTEATDAKVLLEYLLLAYYLLAMHSRWLCILLTHYSLLTLSTRYALKVAIVSPRSGAPHIAHYDFSPLTAMTPESICRRFETQRPVCLAGANQADWPWLLGASGSYT